MKINKAQRSDAEVIHKLALQLGYFPDLESVKENINRMLEHSDYELVVVTDHSDRVIAWMSVTLRIRIEDSPFLQVAALVTDESARGQGAGRLLMDYAIKIAQEKDLPFVGLYSSLSRTNAHAFYEYIGFKKSKESFFFRKDIKSGLK